VFARRKSHPCQSRLRHLQFRALIAVSYETLMTRGTDYSRYRKLARRFADDKILAVEKSAEVWKRRRFQAAFTQAGREVMRMPTPTRTG
jgi:hypothetical protein